MPCVTVLPFGVSSSSNRSLVYEILLTCLSLDVSVSRAASVSRAVGVSRAASAADSVNRAASAADVCHLRFGNLRGSV